MVKVLPVALNPLPRSIQFGVNLYPNHWCPQSSPSRPTPTLKRTQHYLLYQLATDLLNPTIGLKRQKNRKIRSKKHGPLITYEQTEFVPEHPTGIETIGFVFLVRNKNVDFLRKWNYEALEKMSKSWKQHLYGRYSGHLLRLPLINDAKVKNFDFSKIFGIFFNFRNFLEIFKCLSLTSVWKNFDYSVVHWLTLIIRQSDEISPNLKIINFIYNLFDM